jgi:hypothetical protein
LGKGESEIATKTEEVFAESDLLLGYRASVPYVIVKVWLPVERLAERDMWKQKLEAAIGPWVVARGEEDLLDLWWQSLDLDTPISLLDTVSGGVLMRRLSERWTQTLSKSTEQPSITLHWQPNEVENESPHSRQTQNVFSLKNGSEPGTWQVLADYKGKTMEAEVRPPFRLSTTDTRARKFIVEKALHLWLLWLKQVSA